MALIALIAYWAAFGVIVARRPDSPTRGDMLFVRYGYLLLLAGVCVAAPFAWRALRRL